MQRVRYLVSGSGIFVALTESYVCYNFPEAGQKKSEVIRGGKSAQFYYNVGSNSEKNSLPSSGTTVLFREKRTSISGTRKSLEKVIKRPRSCKLLTLMVLVQTKAAAFALAEHKTHPAGRSHQVRLAATDSSSKELKQPILAGQLYKADGTIDLSPVMIRERLWYLQNHFCIWFIWWRDCR